MLKLRRVQIERRVTLVCKVGEVFAHPFECFDFGVHDSIICPTPDSSLIACPIN